MSNQDWLAVSRTETERANLAEWRANSIRAVSRALTHLNKAYETAPQLTEEIGAMREHFAKLFAHRVEKLDAIAAESRTKAARALEEGQIQNG